MISKLELKLLLDDLIQVIDKSEYDYSELPSKFSYENTVSVNFLLKITSDDNKVEEVYVAKHNNKEECMFLISEDGYYRINHIIIPTREWLDKLDLENVVKFEKIYFYMDGGIYEYDFKIKQAKIIDPILLLGACDLKSTVFSSEEDFVIINEIKTCLINMINNKFVKQSCKETPDPVFNVQLEYIQMLYNVLNYYIECGDLLEAELLLEEFLDCYNICKENPKKCKCL